MNNVLAATGSAFIFLAALIHIMIFFFESVLWQKPKVQRLFGIRSQADAALIKPWAYNQGFYNAFLALGAATGVVMMGSLNFWAPGIALAIFAALSMLLAAIVLITSQPKMARAALIQGVPPLLGIIFVTLALTTA